MAQALLTTSLSIILLNACASTPAYVDSYERQSNAVPLPKQGSNELQELIAEVRDEMNQEQEAPEVTSPVKTQIPLEVNERVEFWLYYFSEKDRERFQRFLNRGESYREMVEKHLQDSGVPKELYYLAMIESGFTIHARSHASAVGVWQFIKPTGQRYGLHVDHYVDERRDPVRATLAAAKYLQDLHNVFQSWYLAMAAYNAGESRIMNAIMRANSRDFWELAEKKSLPKETMNYVPKFIAAAIIGHHPERFGFTIEKTKTVPDLVARSVPSRVRLSDIAKAARVPYSNLKSLNPHIRRGIIPDFKSNYEIWIPASYTDLFAENQLALAKLPKQYVRASKRIASTSSGRTHRVRSGESLSLIARKYGTSVHKIKSLNRLRSNNIMAGTRLVVSEKAPPSYTASSGSSTKYHSVRRGDTLAKISKRYNLTINHLKRTNGLKSNTVYVGQKLALSSASRTYAKAPSTKKYKVRRGDNLYNIAKKFDMSLDTLKRLNSLSKNRIYIGQVLNVAWRG